MGSVRPPIARAGKEQIVCEGSIVTLDGASSRSFIVAIKSYKWTQLSGSPVILSDSTSVKSTFEAPPVEPGSSSLIFELTVTDYNEFQSQDKVTINVIKMSEGCGAEETSAPQLRH